MKSISLIFVIFILVMMFCIDTLHSQETLVIRVTDWAPIYYKDHNDDWTGLDVEIIETILNEAGLKPKFKNQPWVRGLKNLEKGVTHIVMNMARTDERSKYTNWLGPIRKSAGMGLIVSEKNVSLPVKNLDDLVKVPKDKGKMFGYQRGAFYSQEFKDRLEQDKEFENYFDPISKINLNIKKVLAGRILGFFESPLSLSYRIKYNPDYKGLAIHPFRFKRKIKDEIFYGLSKKGIKSEIFEKINKAFDKLNQKGVIKK